MRAVRAHTAERSPKSERRPSPVALVKTLASARFRSLSIRGVCIASVAADTRARAEPSRTAPIPKCELHRRILLCSRDISMKYFTGDGAVVCAARACLSWCALLTAE